MSWLPWYNWQFNDAKYDAWLSRIEHKLDALISVINKEGIDIMSLKDDVNQLSADLAALSTAVSAAVAEFTSLSAQLTAALGQISDPAVVAQLETTIAGIEAQTAALTAATPAPPPAP